MAGKINWSNATRRNYPITVKEGNPSWGIGPGAFVSTFARVDIQSQG